ncbi:hypothetical protein A2415_01635 [candidate division WWE3 bacterium RIFOXYC1_FULL_39_7]|uniref:SUF system FeS cluster assembly SufBD core domain-containing protein n=2 Tax=Katanobacteria TaxID=422282 RepID=A0A1F4X6X3_UNCKA|nr:MAG: hypothetical protein A2415_01635 [candidate division WWE3 bacterium RIFOXYC1_FULL_39_7]OGC76853.1 MAG: hypothetical protein A2619_03405 [candidate division WWE3 bacterium RIFOXYD1_FULL_39_9]
MKSQIVHPEEKTIIEVSEDTQFVVLPANYLDEKSYSLELIFNKEGVSAEIVCMYVLPQNGKLRLTTVATHIVPHTSCNTIVRGVLDTGSESYYTGKIIIKKTAQQTSSFLSDRALVIGNGTKNNSEPILEIDADDVKASHGASTGKIDKNELYYLQTRGLTEKEASDLIIAGFFNKILDTIADPAVRQLVASAVTADISVTEMVES